MSFLLLLFEFFLYLCKVEYKEYIFHHIENMNTNNNPIKSQWKQWLNTTTHGIKGESRAAG